jgi:SAM-dependent methyltransferase
VSKIEVLSPAASVSMADEWFELAHRDHFWMQWRHAVLLRQLRRVGFYGDNALEIGCGHGVVRKMLEDDLGIRVDACDLNRAAIERAEIGNGRLLLYNVFDRNRELLSSYALVLLMDVIEHVQDDVEFLRVSVDHLRPGGMVAVNVPAHMFFYSRYDEVAGHVRRYTTASMRALFRRAHLHPISLVQWGFLLTPLLLARKVILRFTPRSRIIETGFSPPNAFSCRILNVMQRIEMSLPFCLPLGSSLLAIGRKSN